MSDLVTLDREHPDFAAYLRGTFAADRRALPLRSLNVRTRSESVTFQIVPLHELRRPSWWMIWLKALRPRSFLHVLVPLLFVFGGSQGGLDPDLPWIVTAGVMCLYAAVLLRNDVQDHLSGFDRVRSDRGSRAIQNGWLTASQVETASWIFLIAAILSALPVVWARPATSLVILTAAAVGGANLFRSETSFRDLRAGQLTIFLMGGPLLFGGIELAVVGTVSTWTLLAGIIWGWMLLFPVHLRDLEHLIAEGQSGRASLIGRGGFDRAYLLISAWWFGALVGTFAVLEFGGGSDLGRMVLLAISIVSVRFILRLRSLRSPAGSAVAVLRRQGEYLFLSLVLLWILESLWRLLP